MVADIGLARWFGVRTAIQRDGRNSGRSPGLQKKSRGKMPLDNPGFWCFPVCKSCREAQTCSKMFDVPQSEHVDMREFVYRRDSFKLVCGHTMVAPIVTHLRGIVKDAYCDRCGDYRKIAPEPKAKKGKVSPGQLELPPF